MVPPSSDRISRVPPYLSCTQFHRRLFSYGAITHYGRTFHSVLISQLLKSTRLFRFRSPLLSESRLMSFPRATEMFQFTRFASCSYVFTAGLPFGKVSPFRNLRIKANLPAPRSLSQAITSFVAYHCQGIHHMLLVT